MCWDQKVSAGKACFKSRLQCSALQAKAGSAKKARRKAAKGKDAMVPHYEVLACEYHVSIVAGLSLIGASAICSTSQRIALTRTADNFATFLLLAQSDSRGRTDRK